jgi:hypothetical protein
VGAGPGRPGQAARQPAGRAAAGLHPPISLTEWLATPLMRRIAKFSKVLSSRGVKIPYVPEKQSAAAEIERQLRRLVVFPRQRPPSERHSSAEVPVRRRDVREFDWALWRQVHSPGTSAPGSERRFEQVVSRAPSPDM